MPKALVVMLLALSLLLVACGTADRAAPAAGAAMSTSGVGAATPTAAPASGADTAPPTATAPATAARQTATPAGDDLTPYTDTTCDGIISASFPKISDVAELAWYASVIVVGTVQSAGQPYFIDSASRPTIATDFTIAVDTPVRGVVGASLGVRQFGGTLGACTQSYAGDPAFAIGERVLLLLIAEPDGPVNAARLYPAFGQQGVWAVTDAGLATSGAAHMQSAPQPLADVILEIVTALQGTPPTGDRKSVV